MALSKKSDENSTASQDAAQHTMLCLIIAVLSYGITVGIMAYNVFSIIPIPPLQEQFYAYATGFAMIIVSGLVIAPMLSRFMDLGSSPWITFCACTGSIFLGGVLSNTLVDMASDTTSTKTISRGLGLIWFIGISFLFSILTHAGFFRALLNMFIICIAMVIPFVAGIFIMGLPKTSSPAEAKLVNIAFNYPRTTMKALKITPDKFKNNQQADRWNSPPPGYQSASSHQGEAGGSYDSTYTPPAPAPPPPKPAHEQLFMPVRNAGSLPALEDAIQEVIRRRSEMDSFGFSSQISELNQTWNADQRAVVLDALLKAGLHSDVQQVYISLLTDSNDNVASNAIRRYLFQPGLKSPEIALRSLGRLPDEALSKLKEQPDVAPVVEHFLRSISENHPGAETLVPIVMQLGDDQAVRRLFQMAIRPSLNEKSVGRILDAWKARESDPIPPATLIYLNARVSTAQDPLDSEAIASLSSMEVEPSVQNQMAGVILASYRASPDTTKLNLLGKWAGSQFQGRVSKALLDINTPEEFKAREQDFAIATALNITEPLDHVLNIALASNGMPPSYVVDFLKLDRPRAERSLLDKLERKGFSTSNGSVEIGMLEEVGQLKTRQTFASLSRDMKLAPEDRKRFSDANERVTRSYNRERLGTSAGSTAASAGDRPSLNFNSDPAPKPAEKIKVTAGDVVEVRAGEKTERVIITKVEPELLTVVFIDRGDKLDFIGHERVLKVLGRSDNKELIKPLDASANQPQAQTAVTPADATTSAPPAPDTKNAAAPENAKRPVVGLKVEAKKHGDWHAATIERVNGDTSYVTFDGKGAGWDGWLGLNDIRPIGSRKTFLMLSFEQ